ncbi:MAG TPA: spore cortex-lytic protein [Clostridiales bacterium]|nr:spore cortex-lytic protein [Clostridiales bacterium]
MISYPVIPKTITVHLGTPNSNAQNVTLPFADYIKNVASSEIYPTWPEEAIRANILAQISVALNRVYTEFYRSRGYDFDITSTPANDQTFIYQRDIYDNISSIVDEIFTSYLRRPGQVEPLFAQYCDGAEVQCSGLSQWGSLTLANQGLSAMEILQRYYGDDIELVENVPIRDVGESAPPVLLAEGDTGRYVEILQRRLNRISGDFPGIPKISPADGFFDTSTTDAVKKFQSVFGLAEDGIVGRNTWYSIEAVYNAVKRIYDLNSEGIRLSEISTQYNDTLEEGENSASVLILQYYLDYIAAFVPTVRAPAVDGSFGPGTRESVISFQKTYGLPETGIVDILVWDTIQNVYYGLVAGVAYEYSDGTIVPYPGRVLRVGLEGDDVRVLQNYLNYIARTYTDIPTVTADGDFGPATQAAVTAFQRRFGISATEGRVNALTWRAIASVYEDLYNGSSVASGQYPGYEIS